MNFKFDSDIIPFLQAYAEADAYDKGKEFMKVLANQTAEQLKFYSSIDSNDLESGFSNEFNYALRTADDLRELAKKAKDDAYEAELEKMFKAYSVKRVPK
jgi:hypothetical protein